MVLLTILKRKDASSVIVAILIAMILTQPLSALTARLSGNISGVDNGFGYATSGGWQVEYLQPVVWALLQIILLEIVVRIYLYLAQMMKK